MTVGIPMREVTIAVAGHVDHGKTALTLALTGVDTDTLTEEKRRGLTIEPGYAALKLENGYTVSLADVPGHEKLIRNMLVGAAGVSAVLLVVAADEGIMPQTREHLALCALLGVEHGILVITKSDLTDTSGLRRVEETCRAEAAGTFLEGAPVCAVSVRTGQGLAALRKELALLAERVLPGETGFPFRMEIDRVFSRDGAGTVATGTITAGTAAPGDTLTLYPAGRSLRIRALQSHGVNAEHLEPFCRAALNLAGVERTQLRRGDTLAAPSSMVLTEEADVRLTLLPAAPFSVRHNAQLHIYHGTRALLCRCLLRERKELGPGESCFARLRFSQPLAARMGDRFVLRFFSPVETVGGGVLLDLAPKRRQSAEVHKRLSALEAKSDILRMTAALHGESETARGLQTLAVVCGLSPQKAAETLEILASEKKAFSAGGYWLSSEALEALSRRAEALLEAYHAACPLEKGMSLARLREELFPGEAVPATDGLLGLLEERGVLRRRGALAFRPSFRPRYTPELARIRDNLEVLYRRARLSPPDNEAVEASFGRDAHLCRQVAARMTADGVLLALDENHRIHRRCLAGGEEILRTLFETSPSVSLSRFRDAAGISRKDALLLLMYWDAAGLTRREGEGRTLIRFPG